MKIYDEEYFEQEINKKIRSHGVWCNHIESAIHGFPDTIAAGRRTLYIEYKVGGINSRLIDCYQPTQLKVHRDLFANGASVITALVDVDKSVLMFQSGLMLNDALSNIDVRFISFGHKFFKTTDDFAVSVSKYTSGMCTEDEFFRI